MKFYYATLLIFWWSFTLHAQDPGSLYKTAKKALEKYQQGDKEKLEDAFKNVELMIPKIKKMDQKKAGKYWLKAGEVYNEVALGDYKQFLIYNDYKPLHPNCSFKAADALMHAAEHADKKWDKKLALDELLKTSTFITNEGIAAYNNENFRTAYHSFLRVDYIREFLNEQEHSSILTGLNEYHMHLYRTALAAKRSEENEAALELFLKLEEIKFNNPIIYSSLHELYMAKGEKAKARNALQDGRELFPESNALQIAEINWFMEEGASDGLIAKLQEALESEPKNLTLYISLGTVFNKLQYEAAEEGDFQGAQDHFKEAKYYFTRALDVDDKHAPALYNLGALHYNKASVITKELKVLESVKSAENVRAMLAKQAQLASLLDEALPYFQKAEAINPNDLNTIKALMEIYTRKEDSSMSVEFSERLEKVKSGVQLKKSFF